MADISIGYCINTIESWKKLLVGLWLTGRKDLCMAATKEVNEALNEI